MQCARISSRFSRSF